MSKKRLPGEFNEAQYELIKWLSMTEVERIEGGYPATRARMAERLGVSPTTVTSWARMPDLNKEVVENLRASLAFDIADIVKALVGLALGKGKFSDPRQHQAAKILLQTVGMHTDKVEVEHLQRAPALTQEEADEELAVYEKKGTEILAGVLDEQEAGEINGKV